MLRTNLATRPFYNERLVFVVLALAVLAVAGMTVFNVASWAGLSRRQAELVAQVGGAETRARELQQDALRLRRSLDPKELEQISEEAREANALIDRRTFSWTTLFSRFEATLPEELRILSVSPKLDEDGRMAVTVVVVGRRAEDVDAFVENLQQTRAFVGLLSRQEIVNQEGLLEVTLEGQYVTAADTSSAGSQ